MSYSKLTEELIRAIQRYPSLWDTCSDVYHKRNVKDADWESLHDDIYYDESPGVDKTYKIAELKKKWANIRDYYKKELKLMGSMEPGSKRKKYAHFDELSFLRHVYDKRVDTSIENIAEFELPLHSISNTVLKISNDNQSPTTSSQSAKNEQDNFFPFEEKIARRSQNRETQEEDCDLNFLRSFLPEMKKMTDLQKMDFKIGMLQLTKNIKLQSLNNTRTETTTNSQNQYIWQVDRSALTSTDVANSIGNDTDACMKSPKQEILDIIL